MSQNRPINQLQTNAQSAPEHLEARPHDAPRAVPSAQGADEESMRRLRSPERTDAEDIDVVDQASDQSFPASDAPSWTVVTGTGSPGTTADVHEDVDPDTF
jgi:hypothetical protein